jgi:hypothetical protein
VTVDFATADGTATSPSDFLARSGTLTFQAGDTTETITVPINGDTATEPDETFFVNLTNASTATIGDNQASGTIRDDDSGGGSGGSPTLSINDVTTTEGNSGTVSMVFTITLSARATVPVTVDIATTDGSAQAPSDYESRSGRLTFTPGETSKTLTVPVNGDFVDEQNENFFVNLSSASNATIADGHAVGTIIDDDPTEPPPFSVSISDASVTEGDSGTATALFRVTLSTVMAQRVTVEFATSDGSALAGSDYVAQSGRVTFAPGETIEVIAVTVHGDRADEENENFFVNLNTATNATIADGQAVGVIVDDDPASAPQLSINDVTIVEGNAGTTNAVFTITLSAASAQTVTVDFATGAGSAMAPDDFDSTSGTLTFAPGERTSTIAVPVHGDTLAELNEQFFVNLSNATNATIASARGVGTISNDDGGQTPGACRVRESRGMLEIVGDNTANAIQVDDAGNGNISVSSDCGINESFSGVSRLQVLAQGGNDDVRYTLSGTPIMARWVTIDMGDGDDSSSVQASAVTISQNLQIRVQGGSGADRMAAAVDAVLARSNTPLGLFMDGGLGADTMDATVRLRGAPVKGSIRITGDNDNDTLTLNLDLPRTAQRRLRVRIDGGQGVDTCSAPALSQVRRC